jgi:hypothetical protein
MIALIHFDCQPGNSQSDIDTQFVESNSYVAKCHGA